MSTAIDASKIRQMFLCGVKSLLDDKEYINELNVFPVPDGDTGTNMSLTMLSAVREVTQLPADAPMLDVCKAMSSGSLRGARGNSGVILSQLLRGFCKTARENDVLTVEVVSAAMERAVSTAYKAVMKPKEGTILTVAKAASDMASQLAEQRTEDFDDFLAPVVESAEETLARTPDMLPVLKEAGVVDSGGQGLLEFLKGLLEGYNGRVVSAEEILSEEKPKAEKPAEPVDSLKYTYSMKYDLVLTKKFSSSDEKALYSYLTTIGETAEWKTGDTIVTLVMQTNDPGLAIQKCLFYGQLNNITIENLKTAAAAEKPAITDEAAAQAPAEIPEAAPETAPAAEEAPAEPVQAEHKDTAFIAVAAGSGLEEIFRSLGADEVISGGQTMNPSTDDILMAIEKVNADTVFVLPNNKNIVMAANQAAKMCTTSNVQVIPTKTIPQGITAIINHIPDTDADTAREAMTEEIAHVRSAEVTYSVRDTQIGGISIKEGDYMSIGDSGILATGRELNEAALDAVRSISDDSTELISIYYGSDVTEEDANVLLDACRQEFPDKDIELSFGGQPVYYYILSAE